MLKVQKLRDQLGTRITITWSGRNTHRVRTWGGKKNQSFFLKGNELKIILKCILGGVGGPKKNTPSCSVPTPYQLRTSSVPVTPYTLRTKCVPSAYNPRRKTLLDSDWSRSFWTLSLLVGAVTFLRLRKELLGFFTFHFSDPYDKILLVNVLT